VDRLSSQAELLDRVAAGLEAGGATVVQFETHVSRVLVAGGQAFKFKKALKLPFLDATTLETRRFQCEEECRLNRRLAPGLYRGVAAVTGDPAHPALGGSGEAIEYAVRMRAFEQQALWGVRVAQDLLDGGEVDRFAQVLARFHLDAPRAPAASAWGGAAHIAASFAATLDDLAALAGAVHADRLAFLKRWEAQARAALDERFRRRKARGMIRECHGDLHCDNILTIDGGVQAFDCIEFSDSLRWIDVMDDLAFLHMDLACRGRADLAARLLSRYLEATGDYAGLAVMRYYRVHRALVRAKVMLLRAAQDGIAPDARERCGREGQAYLVFAQRCTRPGRAVVMATHGCSGSGKTTFCRLLVEILGAVQLRSDVERKRLYAQARPTVLYGMAATRRTYAVLADLATEVVAAGWPVVVDAACLAAAQRASFRALAADLAVPFFLFDMRAEPATMRARILARRREGRDASDADLAVLERQLAQDEGLAPAELRSAIVIDTGTGMTVERARRACAPIQATLENQD